MRILVVTHYNLPHLGGIEVLSFSQAKALVENGHDVTLISSRTNREPAHELRKGVMIHRYNAWNYFENQYGIPYPIFSPLIISGLFHELRKTNVCIIHSMGFMSSFIAAVLCKLLGVPYILVQNNQFVRYPSNLLNLLEKINDVVFGSYILNNASEIFAVSARTKEYLKGITSRDISDLKNFADKIFSSQHLAREKLRNYLKLPIDKFVVLTCGRLIHNKSMDTVIQTANLLRNNPRYFFVIIGDGVDRMLLQEYISQYQLENIFLLGGIDHDVVHNYYHASDIFVLPSRGGEGFPIALLEAMEASLPVITTHIANQDDILSNRINSFLVEANSPEQIADVLLEYIEKPFDLSRIAEAGKKIAKNKYSIDAHINLLESYLIKTIN